MLIVGGSLWSELCKEQMNAADTSPLSLPSLTARSLKMTSVWLPTLQCRDTSQCFAEIILLAWSHLTTVTTQQQQT